MGLPDHRSLPSFDDPIWKSVPAIRHDSGLPLFPEGLPPIGCGDELIRTSSHEAAHAVMGAALGRPANHLSVGIRHWVRAGMTRFAPPELRGEAEAMISLAGLAGEILADNETPWPYAFNDMADAMRRAISAVGPLRAAAAVDQCWQSVVDYFAHTQVQGVVSRIAYEAWRARALGADELHRLIRDFNGSLPRVLVPRWGQLSLALPDGS